eukprot:m.453116 g.453116  ORF g.453116 m.453116 type:complete len:90 (-) comp20326_c2_seq16:6461-6730(-)
MCHVFTLPLIFITVPPLTALEPVWNKLGKKLASAKGIVVAKMDATANDPPTDYNIQGSVAQPVVSDETTSLPMTVSNAVTSPSGFRRLF